MEELLIIDPGMTATQNESIKDVVQKERRRLFDFIRKRVPDTEDAEDILQDVFYELTEAYRLMKPVQQLSSWLFTVARNKITDMFRKQKPVPVSRQQFASGINEEGDEVPGLLDILPDLSGDPELVYARRIIMAELEEAIAELPDEQRKVFVLHELEDKSFKEIAEITGEPLNTLLSRKRYAVLFLRERLRELYDELFNN